MAVGLFIPCYVDAFFPEVGIATLELLEKLGLEVEYPLDQTCCGQPMANTGCQEESAAVERLFVENFKGFDRIVTPSGSCTHHIRYHLDAIEQTREVSQVRAKTYELVEFLHDELQVESFPLAAFPHKVGLHNGCSSLRGLGHAKPSELTDADLVVNALGFLPQHLVVLLDSNEVVGNIHDAYGRVDLGNTPYGCFMTGPSATADIEGVLIHGAQGVRSLTVLLMRSVRRLV